MTLPTVDLEIGFGSSWIVAPSIDASADLMAFQISRGRTHELDRIEAGTARFLLKNLHGNYWPKNRAGLYYPYIKPGQPISLTATYNLVEYPVYWGYIDAWRPTWLDGPAGRAPAMEVLCSDGLKKLARYIINDATGYGSQLSGSRVTEILDDYSWPAALRAIDAGQVTLQSTGVITNQGAMDHLYAVQDSEGSLFFIGRQGNAIYQDKNARTTAPLNTSQWTFADHPMPPQANMVAWYDADSLWSLVDGDRVRSWPDLSHNARHASQATFANRPIYKTNILNGRPVVRFDGVNDYLTATWGAISQPLMAFVVWKVTADTGANQHAIDGADGTHRHAVFFQDTPEAVGMMAGGSVISYAMTLPWANYIISCVLLNGASSEIWENNISQTTGNPGADQSTGIFIGDWSGLTAPLSGDIAEIIIYSASLSAANRTAVFDYLNNKWLGGALGTAHLAGYLEPELVLDDQYVFNQIRGQRILGAEKTASDAVSQNGIYGLRVLNRGGWLHNADADVQTRVDYLLSRYRDAGLRCRSMRLMCERYPTELWPEILDYELSTRVTVKLNSTTNPAQLNKDYHIEGVEHNWDRQNNNWETRLQLSEVDTQEIYTAVHAGKIQNNAVDTYVNVHDAANGSSVQNDPATASAYQSYNDVTGAFTISRAGLEFDTSALGAGAEIESAELWIYQTTNPSVWTRTFDVVVVDGSDLAATLVLADYGDLLNDTINYGDVASADLKQNTWAVIPLNGSGIAAINKTGTTRFGLRTSQDIATSSPGTDAAKSEGAEFDGGGGTNKPRLIVRVAK